MSVVKKRTENHYTFLQLYVWEKWKNCFSINLVIDKLFDKFVIDILILKVGFHRHSLGTETFVLSSSLFSKSADYSAGSWLFWSLPQNVNLPVLNSVFKINTLCLIILIFQSLRQSRVKKHKDTRFSLSLFSKSADYCVGNVNLQTFCRLLKFHT